VTFKRYGGCPHCNMGLEGRSKWCKHCRKSVKPTLATPAWDSPNDHADAPYDVREQFSWWFWLTARLRFRR
jgi:hypothetical protein